MSEAPNTASEVAAEAVAPGAVSNPSDLNGDGKLDTIERAVGQVHETVTHIAEVVEGLAEKADGNAEEALEDTGHEGMNDDGDDDTTPVPVPWTSRKVW